MLHAGTAAGVVTLLPAAPAAAAAWLLLLLLLLLCLLVRFRGMDPPMPLLKQRQCC
jgi:hypothetical protein